MKPLAKKYQYLADLGEFEWFVDVCPACLPEQSQKLNAGVIFQEKWMKHNIFSWRKCIFKIWNRFFWIFWLFNKQIDFFRKKQFNFFSNFFFKKLFSDFFFKKIQQRCFFEKLLFSNFFSISNFENTFSSWKINIFHPDFFSWQDMIVYYKLGSVLGTLGGVTGYLGSVGD